MKWNRQCQSRRNRHREEEYIGFGVDNHIGDICGGYGGRLSIVIRRGPDGGHGEEKSIYVDIINRTSINRHSRRRPYFTVRPRRNQSSVINQQRKSAIEENLWPEEIMRHRYHHRRNHSTRKCGRKSKSRNVYEEKSKYFGENVYVLRIDNLWKCINHHQ